MRRLLTTCVALVLVAPSLAADELLFQQPWTSTADAPQSVLHVSPPKDVEVADDFVVTGSIGRLRVHGYGCSSCAAPPLLGVTVRFRAWTPAGPGALQQETFLAADDPGFLYDPADPALLDITLPTPFEASGAHFVSVQLAFESWGYWGWWLSNYAAPNGSPLLVRDATAGDTWGPYVNILGNELVADAAFELWSGDQPLDPGTDPCGDWVEVPSPDPEGFADVRLDDLVVLGPDDAWAVGLASQPAGPSLDHFTFTMHWDGAAWTEVPSPSPALFPGPGGTDADLRAVDASGPDDVWAAGSFNTQNLAGFAGTQILVLHWDGTSWTQVPAPNSALGSGNFVSDVEVVAEDDVWFVGDWLSEAGGAPLASALAMHWDGSGFTIHETPYPVPSSNGYGLIDVDALASDDVWAVGAGHDGDMAALTTYILHWDGSRWEHVPADPPGQLNTLYSVEAIAPDDVWVSGSWFDGVQGFPLLLHWDGSGWTEVSAPVAGALLHEASPGELYALKGRSIYKDVGAGWSEVMDFSPLPGVGIGTIASAGSCETLWVAGVESIVGEERPFTARLVPSGPWVDLGGGAPGQDGVPVLALDGPLTPGSQVQLDLAGAAPSALAVVFISFSSSPTAFLGGTLHAFPVDDLVVVGTDPAGGLGGSALFPGAPAGQQLWFQVGVEDPTVAPWGASLSHAVRGTVP